MLNAFSSFIFQSIFRLMSQLELFPHISPDAEGSGSVNVSSAPPAQTLPDYRVRESKRAKHVSIKVSVEGEVEVVIPPNFERAKLPEILEKRRDWIAKTRDRLLTTAEATPTDWTVEKPELISLRWNSTDLDMEPDKASGSGGFGQRVRKGQNKSQSQNKRQRAVEIWSVTYQPGAGKQTLCVPSLGDRLTIRGNTESASTCHAVLRKWLAHRAHKELAPWLRQLGFELDLPCRRISVRGQKTRWASCSSQKDISLNFKLLFLPRPLVHYVLIHELCHTVHMNHSAQFWGLVEEKMPNYKKWDTELKTGWRYVPRWVEN